MNMTRGTMVSLMVLLCSWTGVVAFARPHLVLLVGPQKSSSVVLGAHLLDRRSIMINSLVAVGSFVTTVPAVAVIDPLETLGNDLSNGRWPNTHSPLPSSVKSAAELTAPTPTTQDPNEGIQAMSDLEKALQESSKKKQVEPRTHG